MESFTAGTIDAMRLMATDPRKCTALVHDDACMGGLVMLLDNPDVVIVTAVLQTLEQMASWSEHRGHLMNFLGMMPQLEMLSLRSEGNLQTVSRHLYELLLQSDPIAPTQPRPPQHSHHNHTDYGSTPVNHNNGFRERDSNVEQGQGTKIGQKGRRNSMLVKGGLNRTGKTIVLYIRGLNDREDLECCRNVLIQVKGVISVTFDLKKKRCTLRARMDLKPELLAKAVSKTFTMNAEQVVKDEEGNEQMISFGAHIAEVNKENEEMPDYPSDDNSPTKGEADMARVGGSSKSSPKWGLLKSVGDFLQNSFYW